MTKHGFIIGTAAYMSPEQARGRPVDKRADIWAFGVVLFEMLAGGPLFSGETVTDVLAAVVTGSPDWTRLPSSTPAGVRQLLGRCLEKDKSRRLRDIGDAHLLLESAPLQPAVSPTSHRPAWSLAVLGTLLVASIVAIAWLLSRPADARITRFDIGAPPGAFLRLDEQAAVAMSPDASTIAFVAAEGGQRRIYLRRRDDVDARALPGSENGGNPAFSPDGKTVAFVTPSELRKTSLDGVTSTVVAVSNPRGIAWLDNDTIVYAPEARSGLLAVPASGGTAKTLTVVDPAKHERSHRWPVALPGGKTVLFTIGDTSSPDSYDKAHIAALDIGTGKIHTVLEGAAYVRYASGHLVFGRGGSLYAVRFDPDRVEASGSPVAVLKGIAVDVNTGATHFAIGDDGTLAYAPGNPTPNLRRLVWVSREGAVSPVDVPAAVFNDVRVSPDGTRAAVLVGSIGNGDVWVYALQGSTVTRITFDGKATTPFWSQDGRNVYYTSIDAPNQKTTIYRRTADGSREPEAVSGDLDQRGYLGGIDRTEHAAFLSVGPWAGFADISRLSLGPSMALTPIVSTPANEYGAAVSPDDQWLAYTSPESGRREVYALGLSGARRRTAISVGGGEEPHWSHNGREIYYRSDDRLMAVRVQPGTDLTVDKPTLLFNGVYNLQSESGYSYDVDPKTGRFLMVRLADDHANAPMASLHLAVGWMNEVRVTVAGQK
jgi:serine/threonine-protein kinase